MATVSWVVPLPVTDAGLNLQLASAGNPAHEPDVKLMAPLKPAKAEQFPQRRLLLRTALQHQEHALHGKVPRGWSMVEFRTGERMCVPL